MAATGPSRLTAYSMRASCMNRFERWQVSLFGTNLTNEWYVNGGIDTGLFWGYDFGTVGRPREVGVGLRFVFD